MITAIDLFAGLGGWSTGARMAGVEVFRLEHRFGTAAGGAAGAAVDKFVLDNYKCLECGHTFSE